MTTRGYTPTHEACRNLANQALGKVNGITVKFPVERFGSLAQAKSAARGFQTTFASLRARERRRASAFSQRADMHARDVQTMGPYDCLTTTTFAMVNGKGYEVRISRVNEALLDLEVIDNDTGLPLEDDSGMSRKILELRSLTDPMLHEMQLAKEQNRPAVNPWTPAQTEWAWKHYPDMCAELWASAGWERVPGLVVLRGTQDLAKLPLNVDPFTGQESEAG